MRTSLFFLFSFGTGCSGEPGGGAVDLRTEFPPPPDGGEQLVSEEMVIPAGEERFWCFFFDYDGPDVGIRSVVTFQSEFGHHNILMVSHASPAEFPDGTAVDCTDQGSLSMTEAEPLVMVHPDGPGRLRMDLPEGMAVKLRTGTRLMIQSHYVNATADDIRVQDAINIDYVPESEVQTWAAAYVHVRGDFEIPPHEEASLVVDCEWLEDFSVLYLTGHMHESGTSYTVDWTSAAGTERIYDVPAWDPQFRNEPPLASFEEAPLQIHAGDRFTTTCAWRNAGETSLVFPQEMCATVGIAYPSTVPILCDPS